MNLLINNASKRSISNDLVLIEFEKQKLNDLTAIISIDNIQ